MQAMDIDRTNPSDGDHREGQKHAEDLDRDDDDQEDVGPPLEQRILEVVKGCTKVQLQTSGSTDNDDAELKFYKVKPSTVSAELGLSIEDSTAELCGLLQAVGGGHDGASFVFETTDAPGDFVGGSSVSTMVFYFPIDFERRARTYRRKEDFKLWASQMIQTTWKILKVVTAFGLILSLFILTIAALVGLVAAIVAMSTNNGQQQHRGNSHGRALLLRQSRTLFYTLRQLLWCYALYGDHDGRDPFMSEMAYDASLCLSICCGSPGSFFWWIRVHQLNRRRRYHHRGWGRRFMSWNSDGHTTTSNAGLNTDIEGVRLIRRGEWGQGQDSIPTTISSSSEDQRGLLSIAVEYLFGPTPFHPGPSEAEKWKFRAAALLHLLAVNLSLGKAGVSLQELSPFMDSPPSSIDDDTDAILTGGLQIVSHFNGVPAPTKANPSMSTSIPGPHFARFYFPELAAESRYSTTYEGPNDDDGDEEEDEGGCSWTSILCRDTTPIETRRLRKKRFQESQSEVPTSMTERRYKFTNLQRDQFFSCVFLGTINLVGVIMLRSSLEPLNGIFQLPDGNFGAAVLKDGLIPVLSFYAVLFFILPIGRLIVVIFLNRSRRIRNQQRRALASALSQQS